MTLPEISLDKNVLLEHLAEEQGILLMVREKVWGHFLVEFLVP